MNRRPRRVAAIAIALVVAAFACFSISVVLFGPWWRFTGMPTPEEWSAFFGASALIALGFAWYQIRQVDHSNNALIASNELARQVTLESIRPRVQVALEQTRFVSKNRGAPVEASLFVVVRNFGSSPALDVQLRVSPPFTSLEKFFKPGMMGEHFAEVNRVFNGDVYFRVLNPGTNYVWYLGNAPDIFDTSEGVPRKWEVHAEYRGTASPSPFHDTHVIDLDVEKRIQLPVDPLVRIGKDIEVVGDNLERIRKAIPGELALSEASADLLRSAISLPRRRTGRSSRRTSWKRVQ